MSSPDGVAHEVRPDESGAAQHQHVQRRRGAKGSQACRRIDKRAATQEQHAASSNGRLSEEFST
jgi:hypothetical protein